MRTLPALLASMLLACSSSSSTGTPGDGGAPSSDANAAIDAAEAGSSPSVDGGACNAIANTAPVVNVEEQTGATPTGAGGTLTDGTYSTTAEIHYRASASDPPSPLTSVQETVTIANATAAGADGAYVFVPNGDAAQESRVNVAITTSGSALAFHETCPQTASDTTFDTYTATATSITLYSSSLHLAVTLTKP